MAARSTLLRTGGGVAAGVAGAAAAAALVFAAFTVPIAGAQAKPVSVTIDPVPADAQLSCPGPLLSIASDPSAPTTSSFADYQLVSGGSAQPQIEALAAPDDPNSAKQPPRGLSVAAQPGAASAPLLAAAQSQSAATAEVNGLAVAACGQPEYDSWLVGGATSLGETSILALGNPGAVAATVDLEIYSEQGLVPAAGGRGILVQPHSQHAIPLAGLAPNASATAVHVTSTGGGVVAQLEEYAVTGITPVGVEWIGPTAAPGEHVVVPGAVVAPAASAASAGSDAGNEGVPVLRVLPLGDKDAQLSIGMRAESGTTGGGASSVTVSHGVVSEVPLDKLGTGSYTITVDSTTPIVAAVRTASSDATKGTDFAWFAAATALTHDVAAPVAGGAGAVLHLMNPGASAVSLQLTGTGMHPVTAAVPGGAGVAVPLGEHGVLTTDGAAGLYASVSYSAPGRIGAYPISPPGASASPLTVYPR